MTIGSLYTSMIRSQDIIQRNGSYVLVKETAQGSVNKFYVYKGNDSGYYDRIHEGTLAQCALILENC